MFYIHIYIYIRRHPHRNGQISGLAQRIKCRVCFADYDVIRRRQQLTTIYVLQLLCNSSKCDGVSINVCLCGHCHRLNIYYICRPPIHPSSSKHKTQYRMTKAVVWIMQWRHIWRMSMSRRRDARGRVMGGW